MQAVIKTGSSQYIVVPGQELVIDKLKNIENPLVFSEVLLFSDDEKTLVGTPTLPGYSVKAEVLGPTKGEKIRVFKYKSKSRYRKHVGFRASLLKIKILSIDFPGSEKLETESKPKAVKETESKPEVKTVKKTVKKIVKPASKK